MVKTFLNYFKWRTLLLMESCQNLGKILRKTNYSSEIYQAEPAAVVYIQEASQPTCDASQLHDLHKT